MQTLEPHRRPSDLETLVAVPISTLISELSKEFWCAAQVESSRPEALAAKRSWALEMPGVSECVTDGTFVSPANSYVEAETSVWWYLEVGSWEIIQLRWVHEGGTHFHDRHCMFRRRGKNTLVTNFILTICTSSFFHFFSYFPNPIGTIVDNTVITTIFCHV